jgi:DNA-binding winged helix-turn-helix (wHTH) protein
VRHGPLTLDTERREAVVYGRAVPLTRLEFDFLRILLEAPGRTFSRDEVITRLHAIDGKVPTDRALDNLVVRLRRKLRDDPRRPRLIQAVWGLGYRLVAPAAEAGLELARQAIDLLPVPAFLLARDRAVVAANPAAERLVQRTPQAMPCYDLLQCRAGTCSLRDRCAGLEAMASRLPVQRRYTITTPAGAMTMQAVYLPLAAGHQTYCLLVLTRARTGRD